MAIELYNDGVHACLMFADLVDDPNDHAVQANQFLIVDSGHGALIDPGGNMTYNALRMAMHTRFPPNGLDYVLASHADPDIVASLNKWLVHTECKVMVSQVWARFVPHFCSIGSTDNRIIPIPDPGMHIRLGNSKIMAVPAHFLHSEGNFQFYDPKARILFSGDMGASMVDHDDAMQPVKDFDAHLRTMRGFHQRYMCGQKVTRYWADMVREMDIDWLVPQHGKPFKGKDMIHAFLDWISDLPCGIDLMTPNHYRLPAA